MSPISFKRVRIGVEYGKQTIKKLSARLNKKYGKGFSSTNLWYFREFYVVYSNRGSKIRHKACGELISMEKLRLITCKILISLIFLACLIL